MINTNTTRVKKIEKGDSDFTFVHGFSVYSRASLEISALCPAHIRLAIERALCDGYLKPVAYMKDTEYMWEKLAE